jgi:hypothetical protein
VIASHAATQCDAKFTLRAVTDSPAFGVAQRRVHRGASSELGQKPLEEMIAVVSFRIIALPALSRIDFIRDKLIFRVRLVRGL